jgi:hypothetical protein
VPDARNLPAGCEQLKGALGSCMTISITGAVTKNLTTPGTSGNVGQTCADWAANRNNHSSDEATWFKLPTPTGSALTEVQSDLAISDYTGPGTFGADKVTGNTGGQLTIGSQSFKFDSATSTAEVTVKADGSGSANLAKLADASGGATSVGYAVTWTCVG